MKIVSQAPESAITMASVLLIPSPPVGSGRPSPITLVLGFGSVDLTRGTAS